MAGNYKYPIGSRDLDAGEHARVCAVGSMVLEAAGDDADTLGFGVSDLGAGGAAWVLSRVALELERLPARGETLDIYTWVSDYGRLMTTRNMDFAPFGFAVTQWVMIDLSTRRPLDLSALANKGASLVDRDPPIELPRRIPASDRTSQKSFIAPQGGVGGDEIQFSRQVSYSDIDFNGHVNSMKYLEWMIDSLCAEELEALSPTKENPLRIDINYLHEATLGQQVTVYHTATDFDIRNSEGVSICRASFSRTNFQ